MLSLRCAPPIADIASGDGFLRYKEPICSRKPYRAGSLKALGPPGAENRTRSAVRDFVVLRDRPLQVVVFIAGDETDLLESGELLFGFR
jgi:hypothetical protein